MFKNKEFPLVNKFLEEHEKDSNDNDTDKIFYLKNYDKLYNMNKTQHNIYGDSYLKNLSPNTLDFKTNIILKNINNNNLLDKKISSTTYQNSINQNFYKNAGYTMRIIDNNFPFNNKNITKDNNNITNYSNNFNNNYI